MVNFEDTILKLVLREATLMAEKAANDCQCAFLGV